MGANSGNNWITGCDADDIRHGYLLQSRTHNNLIEKSTGSNAHTSNGGSGDIVDFHGEQEYMNEVRFMKLHGSADGAGIGMAEWSEGLLGSHEWSGEYNYVHDNEIMNCVYGIRHVWSPQNKPDFYGDSSGAAWVKTWPQIIENNYIHHNAQDGIRADLGKTYSVIIRNNRLEANGGYGIYLAPNSTEYTITGNLTGGQTNGNRVFLGSADGTYAPGD